MRCWPVFLLVAACSAPTQEPLDLGSSRPDGGATGLDATSDAGLDEDAGDDAGSTDIDPGGPCGDPPPGPAISVGRGPELATIEVVEERDCRRLYRLTTTATLRGPGRSQERMVDEPMGGPRLRSGDLALDALYALALAEAAEASVDAIRDGAFDNGNPVPCGTEGCFETGALWHWVWTRDTAYAADLGLARHDPSRMRRSLEMKISARRDGSDRQIIQDTGTGGSYPISTDRVVWALGAKAVLAELTGTERAAFQATVIEVLRNTAAHDRVIAYDPSDGLYTGETSFLDWHEQSYPPWVATDPVQIGMSKALSTNVLQVVLLDTLADLLAETSDPDAPGFRAQAEALKVAIRARFPIPEQRYGSFIVGPLDPSPVERVDGLGLALAILADVIPADRAGLALAAYPLLPFGPPVIWPAEREAAIYHNRAIWPFVTAYLLKAGALLRNDVVVTNGAESLIRGAALELSNMESFEMTTGRSYLNDPPWSGPVLSSERQLWSIGGFFGLVEEVLVGASNGPSGLELRPYVPRALRARLGDRVRLRGLRHRGGQLEVTLHLPAATSDLSGAYAVGVVRLNGTPVQGALSPLTGDDKVEIELIDTPEASAPATLLGELGGDDGYGPRAPSVTGLSATGQGLRFTIDPTGEAAARISFQVFRDGVVIADDLPGATTTYVDTTANAGSPSHCYTVAARYLTTGNVSHRSAAACWWGTGFDRIRTWDATTFEHVGGTLVFNHGRDHYESWGDVGHSLTVRGFVPTASGPHLFQVLAGNGAGPIETGITCGVKRLQVIAESNGAIVAEGHLFMPQLGDWEQWRSSSFVLATLNAGTSYRIVIDDDGRSVNMSAFEHYIRYTAGMGGSAPFSRVNIAELKALRLVP